MDPAIARKLIEINGAFYERFAAEFSASRHRLNPGIERVLDDFAPLGAMLDVGCGDARVGHAWAEGRFPGQVGYVGVDRSAGLLAARERPEPLCLVELDLTGDDWAQELRRRGVVPPAGFTTIVSFAVLHHIPDRAARVRLLGEMRALLAPHGQWALSTWQPLRLPRLARRVLDWGEVGLRAEQLEPGDLLLDWHRGGRGLRYVHHYEAEELREDCAAAGLRVDEEFRSDGEGGALGLYVRGSLPASALPSILC